MNSQNKQTILALDGNSILNRAFYGIKSLTNRDGIPTNAVYGFLNILLKQIETLSPIGVCVAFDLPAPTFRHKKYPDYKAKRKPAPEELRQQFPIIKDVLRTMDIPVLELEGFEADDILGTISHLCENADINCKILTGDRDALQLTSDNTEILLVTTKEGTVVHDIPTIQEKYGLNPNQLIDVKALMGDASDNIPGVAGIGEKTALNLIQTYQSLDNVYSNAEDLSVSVKNRLIDGHDTAYLSKDLAIIERNVPLSLDINDITLTPYNPIEVTKIFRHLGFASLLQRLKLNETVKQDGDVVTIDTLLSNIGSTLFYYLDKNANIIATPNMAAKIENIKSLKDIFEDPSIDKIGFNLKEDIIFLKSHGIAMRGISFDIMLAAFISTPEYNNYELTSLAGEYLGTGVSVDASDEIIAIFKAATIKNLYKILKDKLHENEQDELYNNIELPLIHVLADMQINGFLVDQQRLTEFGANLDIKINELIELIYESAGGKFNINSPKQLGVILFEQLRLPIVKKTKTGYSTNVEVLDKLRHEHEIIEYILEYRKLSKLRSTYVTGLLAVIDPIDGRIHSSFNQMVTVTGRISSTEPNLQNIPVRYPLGREMRKMFIAPKPDFVLVDADYSQIELRVLAHIANDEAMLDTFKNNEDIHTRTASEVFRVPLSEVTDEMRSHAKAVNFGIVYGIGDFSLAQDIHVSRKEARQYIDNYLTLYPGIKKYMTDIVESGKANGYVSTLFSRRRYLPELASRNFALRSFGERAALNTPIQGTAADIIKIAMIRVHSRLLNGNYKSRLILQVHDELIVETALSEVGQVRQILIEEMSNAAKLNVELVVDIGMGDTWYDSK